jgi:hypothetical protein
MTNLLAQAINCDDADRAANMIQDALGIESTMSSTTASRRNGPRIVSGTPGSSEGSRRRCRARCSDY